MPQILTRMRRDSSFHREGVAVGNRGYLAEVVSARRSGDRQRRHEDRQAQFHCYPISSNPTYDTRYLPESQRPES